MRKTQLILAAAVAFDLGVLVVASQAASDDYLKYGVDKSSKASPQANATISLNFSKFDAVNTPQSCMTHGGKTTTQNGVQGCLLPGKANADANSAFQGVSTTR